MKPPKEKLRLKLNQNMRNNMNNINQSTYQKKTEETQKTEFSQENNNLLNDPNYCPIHGYHGQGNVNSAINANVNVNASYGTEDIDNYRFYESKNVTKRVENINRNINNNINSNKNKWPKVKKDMKCLNYTLLLKLHQFILKC